MSRQTTNYGLTKPDYTDTADIEVINSNMDIVDNTLKVIDTKAQNVMSKNSSPWSSTTTYTVGQYCISNNSLWKCLVQHSGQTPQEGTYWTKVSLDTLGAEISAINSNLFNKIYPIGSIYMSVSPTNPSTLFGGTWVAWGSGRVPVGVNTSDSNFNTVEKTGGYSTHTLTVNEIPSHNHGGTTSTDGSHTHLIKFAFASSGSDRRALAGSSTTTDTKTEAAGSHSHTITTQGGGASHNNLQPYITCYMWKRTA